MLSAASPPCRNLSSPRPYRIPVGKKGRQGVPPILFLTVIYLKTEPGDDYRQGYYPFKRHHCDRNEPGPIPPALLPVRHSPSRRRHRRRWWSLTPPLHPLPWLVSLWLVRSLLQLSSGPNPAWTHRPVTLPFLRMLSSDPGILGPRSVLQDTNAKGWESGSSSGENPSDGPLACLSIVKVPKKGALDPTL